MQLPQHSDEHNRALAILGLRVSGPGFPFEIDSTKAGKIVLALEHPGLLSHFGGEEFGMALLDANGDVVHCWGLACRVPNLKSTVARDPQLLAVVRMATKGSPASVHRDGLRFSTAAVDNAGRKQVLLLVQHAREEAVALAKADHYGRMAESLKKIGKVLTMHQTLQPMAVAVAHAIASTSDLAAVLMWVRGTDDGPLELVASVGVDEAGLSTLARIDPNRGSTCAAELSASRLKPVIVSNVRDNPVTAQIEAKFCYLPAGGLMIWPLTIGNKLVGLLELVGREDSDQFLESEELYSTVAEHLSLAMNSALMYEGVERRASFDPLTGIANHRTMQDFLLRRVSEAERSSDNLGVIMIDVDHFRKFNEEEGHDAGDRVLKLVAEVLETCVRPYDLAARYGGEEFTVVMPGGNAEATRVVAERIRTQIEKIDYVSAMGQHRRITASLGFAVYPANGLDGASLLKAADLALYKAKETRNSTIGFEGMCHTARQSGSVDMIAHVVSLVPDKWAPLCRQFFETCRPHIDKVAEQLQLPALQARTLEAAAYLWPYWRAAKAEQGDMSMDNIRSDLTIRPVVACVDSMDERFDGHGPRGLPGKSIGLTTRLLSALDALVRENGAPFVRDMGRFDPHVVALLTSSDRAA